MQDAVDRLKQEKEVTDLSLELIKRKLKTYFDSETIEEMMEKIKEAKEYIEEYDSYSEFKLENINKELKRISNSIENNNRRIKSIENDEQFIESVHKR